MSHIFLATQTASLSIQNSKQRYSIRRVYCVGRNYADHALEMGANPKREKPFFFCKPNDNQAIIHAKPDPMIYLPYPPMTCQLDHEIELVLMIGKQGSNIPAKSANAHIYGYAVGLDMTRRDLQAQMKKDGKPWEIGKAFDGSAIIGQIHLAESVDISSANICLSVNATPKQVGNVNQMIWQTNEIIAQLSTLFTLHVGDVIFTGTPAGVGAVKPGDILHAHIDGLSDVMIKITQ